MDTASPRTKAPAEWLESLAKSEAQLAAGQTVPSGPIRQRLRDSIDRLEAKPTAVPQQRQTTPRR